MITVDSIVDLLNSMHAADPVATHALCCNRVPCSQQLADHPAIIVDELGHNSRRWVVGLVGFLNGLLVDEPWRVAMRFRDDMAANPRMLEGFMAVPTFDVAIQMMERMEDQTEGQ